MTINRRPLSSVETPEIVGRIVGDVHEPVPAAHFGR